MLLPIPWEFDQIDQIRDAVVQGYEEFQQGIEPGACVARMPRTEGSRAQRGRRVQAAVRRQATHVGPGTGEWRRRLLRGTGKS